MLRLIYWCFILVLLSLVASDQSTFPVIRREAIINALERALYFFWSNTDQVNLDAGIGTRIAADQLRPYSECDHCQRIKDLVDLSEFVTRLIGQSVQKRQPDYYAQLSFLLVPGMFAMKTPFQFHQQDYQVNEEIRCSSLPFIEKNSDQCLHALSLSACENTRSCMKLMADPNACRYSLTHQILYSMLVRRSSCSDLELSSIDEHQLVARMLAESRAIARANFSEIDRDLFMEEIAFGGLLGWSEFFQDNNWFKAILNWQHSKEGCYGNDRNHLTRREEMQMSHQCLSHRTSVAIAALSQILRYMLSRDI